MAVTMSTTHVVKKEDTLEKIAKHYHHRDGRIIWKAPENRRLGGKSHDPKSLVAGDKLFIPPNEMQLKENAGKLASLRQARDMEVKVRAELLEDVARRERSVKVYDELIKGFTETMKEVVDTLEKQRSGMKNVGQGVDVAAQLAKMGVNLGRICKAGATAARTGGEELLKANKEAAKAARDLATDLMQDATVKAVGSMKESDNATLATIGIIADSWDKMNSPSFWANMWTQGMPRSMGGEGRGWSEAATMEVGEDIEKRIKAVLADGAKHIRTLQADQQKAKERLANSQKLVKECEARARLFEDQASKLPQN